MRPLPQDPGQVSAREGVPAGEGKVDPRGATPGGELLVWSDGAARGNPGPAGIGGLAMSPCGQRLVELSEGIGIATNNVAEYTALIRVLELASTLGYTGIVIHSDSELLVKQLNGAYRVKSPALKPLASRARQLLKGYRRVKIVHVPRNRNRESDRLANLGVDRATEGEGSSSAPGSGEGGVSPPGGTGKGAAGSNQPAGGPVQESLF